MIDFRLLLALSLQQQTLGLKLSPLTTRLPRCNINPAQLKAIPSSLRGDCSSFEVLIQCNRIESRVITGEALPLPLQLGPDILWFKFLVTRPRSSCISCARTIIRVEANSDRFFSFFKIKNQLRILSFGFSVQLHKYNVDHTYEM